MLAWHDIVTMSNEQLASLDIAVTNLACAAGLPGCEKINHDFCLGWLDEAADLIRKDTPRRLPLFQSKASRWNYSEARFRVEHMVTILQRDLGVRYNVEKMRDDAVFDTEDVFIHGVIQGRGGTCASIPVLCVAVGRRLGYPLKLVKAKCHLFFRWDASIEKFNCEATSHGVHSQPDKYYRSGRYECTPQQEREGGYLESLCPRAEFGDFMIQRGWLWFHQKQNRKMLESFLWGINFFPEDLITQRNIGHFLSLWSKELDAKTPAARPAVQINQIARVFRNVPLPLEQEFFILSTWEQALNDPRKKAAWEAARTNPSALPRQVRITIGA